jgi:uncharacterized protein
MSVIKSLKGRRLFKVTQDFAYDPELEVLMGSVAYGAATGPTSDIDIYGICIPDINIVFPQTIEGGYVEGFTKRPTNFESAQQHHINIDGVQHDVTVYSIVKTFALAVDNNPNILDILWVPDSCVLHATDIGNKIRDNRQLFLSKHSYHRFRGYAYAQQKRMIHSNRTELIEQYGFDVKNAYHIIRLALQCKQILETGDMVLDANSELLKEIRAGKYSLDEINQMFEDAEADLETLYKNSDLRDSSDMESLQKVLLECLEMKYGYLP